MCLCPPVPTTPDPVAYKVNVLTDETSVPNVESLGGPGVSLIRIEALTFESVGDHDPDVISSIILANLGAAHVCYALQLPPERATRIRAAAVKLLSLASTILANKHAKSNPNAVSYYENLTRLVVLSSIVFRNM